MRRGGSAKIALLLFGLTLAVYLLGYRGISAGDDLINAQTCEHLATGRGLAFSTAEYDPSHRSIVRFFFRPGRGGAVYSVLGPGFPIAAAPLCWAAQRIAGADSGAVVRSVHIGGKEWRDADGTLRRLRGDPLAFASGLLNPLCCAAIVALFFLHGALEGADPRWAAVCSLCLGFGTFLWCYAETYWTQPLCLLLLLAGLLLLRVQAEAPRPWAGLLGGAVVGGAALVRYEVLVVSVMFLVASAVMLHRRGRLRDFVWSALGVLLPAGLLLWWNWHRFGSPWSTGSPHASIRGFFGHLTPERFAISLLANTVGLNQGLFVFAPPVLVTLGIAAQRWRLLDAFEKTAVLSSLWMLALYSGFAMWETSDAWGPRFLLLTVPLLLLPAFRHAGAIARRAVLLSAVVGFLIQAVGVLTLMDSQVMKATNAYYLNGTWALLTTSEIGLQARNLLERGAYPFWWSGSHSGAGVATVLGVIAISAGLLLRRVLGPIAANGVTPNAG